MECPQDAYQAFSSLAVAIAAVYTWLSRDLATEWALNYFPHMILHMNYYRIFFLVLECGLPNIATYKCKIQCSDCRPVVNIYLLLIRSSQWAGPVVMLKVEG